ncbi:MAG: hypothetical protein K2O60_00970, partial [Ruminococcus sp.]|nr:hypothetical protein [Ruminococcus sp.]
MKKVLSSILAFTLAMASFTVPYIAGDNLIVSSAAELTGELGGYKQELVDQSEIRPHLYVESKLISIDEARQNPTQSVSVVVSGADSQYCYTGLRIYYDSRLTITRDGSGNPDVKLGSAADSFSVRTIKDEPNVSVSGMKGVILESMGTSDSGRDGVLWTLTFTLPDDAYSGDVYPFDIYYKSADGYKGVFTSKSNDVYGQIMQAYTFTRGINNGITNSFNPATDILDINGNVIYGIVESCPAVANVDSGVDGVIAIMGNGITTTSVTTEETTTTTTEETTTTTEETTTTTEETTTTTEETTTTTEETTTTTEETTTTTEETTTTTEEITTTTEETTTTTEETTTTTTTEPAKKLGDIDGNDIVDANDASLMLSYYAYLSTGGTEELDKFLNITDASAYPQTVSGKFGDIDGNGVVDAGDASAILSYYYYTSTGGTKSLEEFLISEL